VWKSNLFRGKLFSSEEKRCACTLIANPAQPPPPKVKKDNSGENERLSK
jgi:hypothetical protein